MASCVGEIVRWQGDVGGRSIAARKPTIPEPPALSPVRRKTVRRRQSGGRSSGNWPFLTLPGAPRSILLGDTKPMAYILFRRTCAEMPMPRADGRRLSSFPGTPRQRTGLCLAFAIGLGASARIATAAPPTDREIEGAVAKAVSFLRQNLPAQDGGRRSLATLALLKAGIPPDAPDMKEAIAKIAERAPAGGKFDHTGDFNYDAGVTLMALANADAKKYRPQIETIAKFLMGNQGTDGEWDYPTRGQGDTSISQYAVLGLWEASRSGVSVPRGIWDKAARWHMSRQLPDGGFTYHPAGPGGGGGSATHTMTVAGTGSLLVARLHLFGSSGDHAIDEEEVSGAGRKRSQKKLGFLTRSSGDADDSDVEGLVDPKVVSGPILTRLGALDKSAARGRKWLADRFSIDPPTTWTLYYLYGLERLTALSDTQQIAGHDWYEEGATRLVASQSPQGTWSDGSGPVPGTSFGVMFLVKATRKMLNRPTRRDPRFGGGLLVGGRGLPENLDDVQIDKGVVRARKLQGAVDELLAELEKVDSQRIDSAQTTLVERVMIDDPEALVGQTERLLKLTHDTRPEVRRTAYWALGRTNDLRVAPALIEGLRDRDPSCLIEARSALRYLSKRFNFVDLPDAPTDIERSRAIAEWKKWYLSVRAYDERDDLTDGSKP